MVYAPRAPSRRVGLPDSKGGHVRESKQVTHNPGLHASTAHHGDAKGTTPTQEGRPDELMTGYLHVDTQVSCMLTRFGLRSLWSLVPFYLAYRRVRGEARSIPGLLRTAFLIEGPRTCYTLSIWQNDSAIHAFGSLPGHVRAARAAFGRTWRKDVNRAEIWSAQFRLWAVSCHNLQWEGLDLGQVLGDQLTGRAAVREEERRRAALRSAERA